ncbi:hypothetical protein OSTOST_24664 [Ostertagia ostertagi]
MEVDNAATIENGSNGDSGKSVVETAAGVDQDRIHISPVPKFFGFKQFKKLLEKHNIGKYVLPKDTQSYKVRTARESVTKLADVPYSEQLLQKTRTSSKLCDRLIAEMRKANVDDVNQLLPAELLKEIKPSPKTTGYRNKCEFTIGLTHEGQVCVGFVGGRFSNNEHYVIPIGDVDNITLMTKKIVEAVTNFVQASGLPPFDEFSRVGVWKMLTVRQFGGDVMLILTVNPFEDHKPGRKAQAGVLCEVS